MPPKKDECIWSQQLSRSRKLNAVIVMQPAPAEGCVLCAASLSTMQGRTVSLGGHVADLTTGARYVDATSTLLGVGSTPSRPASRL